MSNLAIEPIFSDSLSEEKQIIVLREQSNQAIAQHDIEGVLAALDADYQVTGGEGSIFQESQEERFEHWQQIFSTSDDLIFKRTPEKIEISEYLPRAAESGQWVGSWTTAEGRIEMGGSYFASWSKTDNKWKIRSEIFVTLFCNGSGC